MSSPETRKTGPAYYKNGIYEPWDLTASMRSSGNAHVDFCRCSIIKYAFRIKGDTVKLIDDLEKASHYALEAAAALRKQLAEEGQATFTLPLENKKPECNCRFCGFLNLANGYADAFRRSPDCLNQLTKPVLMKPCEICGCYAGLHVTGCDNEENAQ